MKLRIQKYLSQQNILSRRKAEEYILRGWISVNGEVITEMGVQIDPEVDKVTFSEVIEKIQNKYIVLAFNKPRGILTNCALEEEKEIVDLLPNKFKHLSSIGRLDKESEGLILLTDNGIFAKKILNSSTPHEREYEVTIDREFTAEMQAQCEKGVDIDGYITQPCKIIKLESRLFKIILKEGKNRQIRRMLWALGARVTNLKRIRFGAITLGKLAPGKYIELTPEQLKEF